MILKSYPTLDVHGETRDTVVYPVNTFIKDNVKLRNKHIVIIHGKGQGVLKEKVHELLRKNPNVVTFYLDGVNIGATEVVLNISSKFDK
jgi:DNA mismatch repair protein MutS2